MIGSVHCHNIHILPVSYGLVCLSTEQGACCFLERAAGTQLIGPTPLVILLAVNHYTCFGTLAKQGKRHLCRCGVSGNSSCPWKRARSARRKLSQPRCIFHAGLSCGRSAYCSKLLRGRSSCLMAPAVVACIVFATTLNTHHIDSNPLGDPTGNPRS